MSAQMKSIEHSVLARKVQEFTVLYEIGQLLVSTPYPKGALNPILNILHSKMDMERGTITILNPETQDLNIEAAHGLTDQERQRGHYQKGEGLTGKVVETGEPVIISHVGEEPLFLNRTKARGDIEKENISFICVPIRIGSTILPQDPQKWQHPALSNHALALRMTIPK